MALEKVCGIYIKKKFLDEIGDSIKHALVVMSHETLKKHILGMDIYL